MKIKNDLIRIKTGNKKYDFNNLILDAYLNKFVLSQLKDPGDVWTDRLIRYCLLKFDTPFENLQGNTQLHNQQFDVCFIFDFKLNQIISENQIIMQYEYEIKENSVFWNYAKNESETGLSNYYGKKITAIGFNSWWGNDMNTTNKYLVCAVLDTSNYNIYLQENQDMTITRRDIITTDALFYSSNKNKIPGPVHLAPNGIQPILAGETEKPQAILHSIGLSSSIDYIDKEFVIEEDVTLEASENELNITGIQNYLSTDGLIFCNENIYPSSSLYPTKANYRYLILKYKIYQDETIDTGYYYYQAIPLDKFGKMNLKIKYERG